MALVYFALKLLLPYIFVQVNWSEQMFFLFFDLLPKNVFQHWRQEKKHFSVNAGMVEMREKCLFGIRHRCKRKNLENLPLKVNWMTKKLPWRKSPQMRLGPRGYSRSHWWPGTNTAKLFWLQLTAPDNFLLQSVVWFKILKKTLMRWNFIKYSPVANLTNILCSN